MMIAFPEGIVLFIELIISLLSCYLWQTHNTLYLINCLACQTYVSDESHMVGRELQPIA